MILPVILAGGKGTRLWPMSRELMPKQFLPLVHTSSMLQDTITRLQPITTTRPLVICNEEHRFLAAEHLRQINQLQQNLLLESVGKNTAPAIAIAALTAMKHGDDPLLLVLAADHVMTNPQAFVGAVAQAEQLARDGKLVTFGIVPDAPETGYGYIRKGEKLQADDGATLGFTVAAFVEKPALAIATAYLASGDYAWNSGMFMFKASRYLEELQKFNPAMLHFCQAAVAGGTTDLDFIRVDANAFNQCPSDSIDYAVMEKTDAAVMVPLDAGWSDVGTWSSLWQVLAKDQQGNAKKGDVIAVESNNSLLLSEHGLLTCLGVDDLVVVQTKDAVMVAAKDRVQDVKKLVDELNKSARTEQINHREVYRPWGKYDSIDNGARYQVKRITVNPGDKLSIQMHHHRAEHWIVVSGTAKVTLDGEVKLLTENQSVYIPLGAVHSLENPGKIALELIEVQSGAYLGEDDIVRFSDIYGRAK
jgi:mannose-1-phosphate guanylyltransferase